MEKKPNDAQFYVRWEKEKKRWSLLSILIKFELIFQITVDISFWKSFSRQNNLHEKPHLLIEHGIWFLVYYIIEMIQKQVSSLFYLADPNWVTKILFVARYKDPKSEDYWNTDYNKFSCHMCFPGWTNLQYNIRKL